MKPRLVFPCGNEIREDDGRVPHVSLPHATRALCVHHTRPAGLSPPHSPSVYLYLQDLLYHQIPVCFYQQPFVVSSTIPKGCFKGTSQCLGNECNTVDADFRHKAG